MMELVLNTYGTSVSRDNEGFVIANADGRRRLAACGITSISIACAAKITSDAIALAVEKEIDVLFIDKAGTVIARIWSPKYGSVSTIRKGQLAFSQSKSCIGWIKTVLLQKIANQQALMLLLAGDDEDCRYSISIATRKIDDCCNKIATMDGEMIGDVADALRGWEGMASRIYFNTVVSMMPEEYRSRKRTQHPAMDIFNALLNYAYGMLYGKVEGALIKAGIDPYIGVLHRDEYNRPVLAYDVIELYRVWAEYVVFALLRQHAVTEEHYSIRSDGSCWLEPLGRRILIQSLNDYLDDKVTLDSQTRSREYQIFLYCQSLAQQFKKTQILIYKKT